MGDINAQAGLLAFVERLAKIETDGKALDRLIHSRLDGHEKEHELLSRLVLENKEFIKNKHLEIMENLTREVENTNTQLNQKFSGHKVEHEQLALAVEKFEKHIRNTYVIGTIIFVATIANLVVWIWK